MDQPQAYENHRRFVPSFHGVVFFVLLFNAGWALWQVIRHFSMATLVSALLALALFRLFFHIRGFATGNQDRIIRLEMRLRLERVLPAELKSRISELEVPQLIGLRFASDAELPGLVRKALEEKLSNDQIKRGIKNWQADWLRV